MARRALIFANPIAGRGAGRILSRRVRQRIRADGWDAEVIAGKASDVPDDILSVDTDAAIVIGGDGSIRAAAARLAAVRPTNPIPILIVPMGTANLLGRHFAIRWKRANIVEEVAQTLARHRIEHLDAAKLNGQLFLLMAGIGLDAKVVHELEKLRRGPIDYTSYVLPAALALALYRYPALTVTVDGKMIAREVPAVAFVGNVKEYGTGFPILPKARADDGLLDVCVLPCANQKDLLYHLLRALSGEHLQSEGAVYRKGRHVRIESRTPVPVQIDGDGAGYTPAEIDLLPERLAFIVPEKGSGLR
jgi:diacylglycerol kinase (ATP)